MVFHPCSQAFFVAKICQAGPVVLPAGAVASKRPVEHGNADDPAAKRQKVGNSGGSSGGFGGFSGATKMWAPFLVPYIQSYRNREFV